MTRILSAVFAATLLSTAAPAHAAGILVLHPWARPIPPGAPTGAGYMTIVNDGGRPVRLVGGETPAAASIEVHEMTLIGGIMRMRPVPGGLAVPAHGRVELKPGAYHLMLISPRHAYRLGDRIPVTLRFQGAPPLPVTLTVEAGAPPAGPGAR
jgi:periplasmic copper chaperone A